MRKHYHTTEIYIYILLFIDVLVHAQQVDTQERVDSKMFFKSIKHAFSAYAHLAFKQHTLISLLVLLSKRDLDMTGYVQPF